MKSIEINNFDLIKSLLTFPSEDVYYFLQIICRKKDSERHSSNQKTIKTYFITSKDHLERIEPQIIELCTLFCARAYISPQSKSFKRTALINIEQLSSLLLKKQAVSIPSALSTSAGKCPTFNKIYLVDIDSKNNRYTNEVLRFIETNCKPEGNKFLLSVPTVQGIHLLVKPFDVGTFKRQYPDIDVHKNNPTLLYFNNKYCQEIPKV